MAKKKIKNEQLKVQVKVENHENDTLTIEDQPITIPSDLDPVITKKVCHFCFRWFVPLIGSENICPFCNQTLIYKKDGTNNG